MVTSPSTAASWDASLDVGDHDSAITAWQAVYSGREQESEARRARGDIEERSGDAHVVHDGLSAKGHYLRAASSMREAMEAIARIPMGSREGDRTARARDMQQCQDAYSRGFRKYQSISNQGRVDDLVGLQPHPASSALLAHIEHLRAERQTARGAQRRRLSALLDAPPDDPSAAAELAEAMRGSAYARACGMGADPMATWALGDRWMTAAQALANDWPASARRALAWSAWFFRTYNADWNAHLPASRWDSDGSEGYESADALRAELAGKPDCGEPPLWAHDLLAGRLPRRKLPPAGDGGEPSAFSPLFELLLAAAPQLQAGERKWT